MRQQAIAEGLREQGEAEAERLSAQHVSRRVAEMERQFSGQLEAIERQAEDAVVAARLEAQAQAEAEAADRLAAVEAAFSAQLAELEAQAQGALSRSKEQSAAAAEAARAAAEAAVAERVQALDEQCAAQLELIDRQASELLERQASQRGDMAHELERRTHQHRAELEALQAAHERELGQREAEWEQMERDFSEKITAEERAHRREKKLEGQLHEAQEELTSMHESIESLTRASEQQPSPRAPAADPGPQLLNPMLRKQLQARVVAVGFAHAQLLVDGELWASANFTAASMTDMQDQSVELRSVHDGMSEPGPSPVAARSEAARLRAEVSDLRAEAAEAARRLHEALESKRETEERTHAWVRKISEARAAERQAHAAELAEVKRRRAVAETRPRRGGKGERARPEPVWEQEDAAGEEASPWVSVGGQQASSPMQLASRALLAIHDEHQATRSEEAVVPRAEKSRRRDGGHLAALEPPPERPLIEPPNPTGAATRASGWAEGGASVALSHGGTTRRPPPRRHDRQRSPSAASSAAGGSSLASPGPASRPQARVGESGTMPDPASGGGGGGGGGGGSGGRGVGSDSGGSRRGKPRPEMPTWQTVVKLTQQLHGKDGASASDASEARSARVAAREAAFGSDDDDSDDEPPARLRASAAPPQPRCAPGHGCTCPSGDFG